MDDDAQWLTDVLSRAAPKLKFTLWRGLPPLKAWWLVISEQIGAHFMFSHVSVEHRDESAVALALNKAGWLP
ncbi:MAG TPA: hypothetical protein VGB13_04520 [Candidatus Krumholzibacteria bacterium]